MFHTYNAPNPAQSSTYLMDFILKPMEFTPKMMGFIPKLTDFTPRNDGFHTNSTVPGLLSTRVSPCLIQSSSCFTQNPSVLIQNSSICIPVHQSMIFLRASVYLFRAIYTSYNRPKITAELLVDTMCHEIHQVYHWFLWSILWYKCLEWRVILSINSADSMYDSYSMTRIVWLI